MANASPPIPTPPTDRDLKIARRAVERGWISLFDMEEALRETLKAGDSKLLERLKIREEQIRELEVGSPAVPPELAEVMKDPSKRVGKYWIVNHLRSGGMGMVFRGWDPELGRWVALKFLKQIGDDTARAYFRREAQLAAGLDHPNIAKIFEIGEHDGSPFIAMQFIDGDALAGAASKMKLEEKVEATKKIAEAVGFAHAHRVIHRDLKPANVMIDRDRQIYVMDFGLAKQTTVDKGESLGGSTVIVGTPSYMAPEQVLGHADSQSDVYGIGAILYELVTGRPPFTGETPADIMMQVAMREVVWPRKLMPSIPEDLEAILIKALEREKKRRYADSRELLEDLGAFERWEPLRHARRPTFSYVMRKKIRKHPLTTALIAGLVMALVGGVGFGVFTLLQRNRALLQRARAEERSLREQELAARKDEALYRLSSLSTAVMERKRILRSARPELFRERERLEHLVGDLTSFIQEWPDFPQGYYVRARAEYYLGRTDAAEADVQQSLKLAQDFRPGWTLLGAILMERYFDRLLDVKVPDRFKEAEDLLKKVPETLQKGWGARDEITSGQTWGLAPSVEDEVILMVAGAFKSAHLDLDRDAAGRILNSGWDECKAEEFLFFAALLEEDDDRAVSLLTRALDKAPGYAEAYYFRGRRRNGKPNQKAAIDDYDNCLRLRPDYAVAYVSRGQAKDNEGDLQGAVADYSLVIEKPALANRSGLPKYLLYYSRGRCRSMLRNFDGAIADFGETISLQKDYVNAYIGRGQARREMGDRTGALDDFKSALVYDVANADAYMDLGVLYDDMGDFVKAIAAYDESLKLRPDDPDTLANRGIAKRRNKDTKGAIEDYTRAISKKADYAHAWTCRGNAYSDLLEWQSALADYGQAIRLQPDDAEAYIARGAAEKTLKRFAEAIADYSSALKIREDDAEVLRSRADAEYAARRYDDAIADYTRIVKLKPDQPEAYYWRAQSLYVLNRYSEASAEFTHALDLKPDWADAYFYRGYCAYAQRQFPEANADFTRALDRKPDHAEARYWRGQVAYKLDKYEAAISDFDQVLKINPDHADALYWRGAAKYYTKDYQGAVEDYTRVLELRREQPEIYFERGRARLWGEDFAGAAEDFTKAIELRKDWAEAYVQRGFARKSKGDAEGAIRDLMQALESKPESTGVHAALGYLRYDRREWKEALSELRRASEAAGEDHDYPQIYLWLIRSRTGEREAATTELRRYLKDRPSDGHGDWPLSIAKFLMGETSDKEFFAAAASEDSRQGRERQGEMHFYAGMKRVLSGDRAGALGEFRECLKVDLRTLAEYWSAGAEIKALEK